jgi:hypothetical protein
VLVHTPEIEGTVPEYHDLRDENLSNKLYAKAGLPLRQDTAPQKPLLAAGYAVAGPPVFALLIGSAIIWAISGFRERPKSA